MDKIREEFEKWLNSTEVEEPEMDLVDYLQENKIISNTTKQQYQADWAYGFYAGYKSRDEEIAELIKQKTIMRNIINLRDKEIKKLKDALERVSNELLDDKIPEDIYSFIERVGIIAEEAIRARE